MTTEHNGVPRPPDAELARIAAELRALGEPELDEVTEADALASLVRESAVPTAFALVHAVPEHAMPEQAGDAVGLLGVAPLSELDQARVWRKVLARRAGGEHHVVRAPSWRATWVAVATAAGLALVPMLSTPGGVAREATPAAHAAAEALGTQAHAALEGVPGEADGGRAAQLAAQYSARLAASDSEAAR